MNSTAVEIINLICQKLGIAVDWTSDNVLPKIQELITSLSTAKYLENHICWIIGLCIIVLGIGSIIMGAVMKKLYKNDRYYDETGWIIAGVILIIIGMIMFFTTLIPAIEWKHMPEIKAYKWINNYIKNHN